VHGKKNGVGGKVEIITISVIYQVSIFVCVYFETNEQITNTLTVIAGQLVTEM
jgi:hypothetical protein